MTTRTLLCALAATTCLTGAASAADLTRMVTVPLGAEITGMFVHEGDLFFNVQHPDETLPNGWGKATVGVVSNVQPGKTELALPASEADKQVVRTSMGDYQVLLQEGDFGIVGEIPAAKGQTKRSNDPDFNAFVATGENAGYLFTNWENRPGGMSRVMMSRAADGTWSVDQNDAMMVDFSGVQGTWVNCFGTLSPWGNPLSSEELYFDNTADWNDPEYKYIDDVAGLTEQLGHYPNPYNYGYIVEITDPAGTPTPVKAFAMGRFSHENSVVMPDQRTVYLSDDGTDVVFYKFVADTAGDLSAGTLYAAKITQLAAPGTEAGKAELQISWIELAHGTHGEIASWIKDYDGITQADKVAGQSNYITDEEIAAWARGEAEDNRVAFLESRKAAKAKGATAEFRKMEGVNINYAGVKDGSVPYMYMAMTEATKGMADDSGDIQLTENKCGVVYEMRLDDNFNTAKMVPVVAGGAYDEANAPNACDTGAIANPDNIVVLNDGRVLIGEDSGAHENNTMWLYTPARSAM